jgi:hypothetical protein
MNGFRAINGLYKLLFHKLKKKSYMGYAILHMEKTNGTDSTMSAHIERTIKPKNADENRTYLNQELISFPDGVTII